MRLKVQTQSPSDKLFSTYIPLAHALSPDHPLMARPSSTTIRLSAFYGALFLVIGMQLPFWPVWLSSRGMSASEIGLLLSAGMWVRIIANPLIAHIADRRDARKPLIVMASFGALAASALYLVADGFIGLLIVALISSAVFSAAMPLGENLTMLASNKDRPPRQRVDYGRVRLWGSITFILAAVAGGQLLEAGPPMLILYLILAGLALTGVAALCLPNIRASGGVEADGMKAGSSASANHSKRRSPIRYLLRDRRFCLFLVAAGLLQSSHAVLYGFATLHWRAAGHSETLIGLFWAEGVIAEIILFAVAAPVVARLGPMRLFAVAAVAGIIRWTVTGATDAVEALLIVQVLHAFTFGAAHLATMHFIAAAVPAAWSATAQSLYASVSIGIIMAGMMMGAGELFAALGSSAFYVMAVVSAAGGALAIILSRLRPPTIAAGPVN